jgi:hypothetical protein
MTKPIPRPVIANTTIHQISIWVKNSIFMPTVQLVEKYFFTLLWQLFVIYKKVAQCALLYTEKIEKNEILGLFW